MYLYFEMAPCGLAAANATRSGRVDTHGREINRRRHRHQPTLAAGNINTSQSRSLRLGRLSIVMNDAITARNLQVAKAPRYRANRRTSSVFQASSCLETPTNRITGTLTPPNRYPHSRLIAPRQSSSPHVDCWPCAP